MIVKNNSIVHSNVKFVGLSEYADKKLHYHKKSVYLQMILHATYKNGSITYPNVIFFVPSETYRYKKLEITNFVKNNMIVLFLDIPTIVKKL